MVLQHLAGRPIKTVKLPPAAKALQHMVMLKTGEAFLQARKALQYMAILKTGEAFLQAPKALPRLATLPTEEAFLQAGEALLRLAVYSVVILPPKAQVQQRLGLTQQPTASIPRHLVILA